MSNKDKFHQDKAAFFLDLAEKAESIGNTLMVSDYKKRAARHEARINK